MPHRFRVFSGRRIPPRVVTAAAATGTLLVTFVALMFFLPRDKVSTPEATRSRRGRSLLCPVLLWGPLLGALTSPTTGGAVVTDSGRRCSSRIAALAGGP